MLAILKIKVDEVTSPFKDTSNYDEYTKRWNLNFFNDILIFN